MTRIQIVLAHVAALVLALVGLALWNVYGVSIALLGAVWFC